MKSFLFPIVLAVAAFTAVSPADQLDELQRQQPARPRITPPMAAPPVPQSNPYGGNPGVPGEAIDTDLKTNHRLSLTGSFGEKREIDLSVTGVGPRFNTKGLLPDDSIITANFLTSRTSAGILVSYDIELMIFTNLDNGKFERRGFTYSGTVLCQSGEAVSIYHNKSGAQSLVLNITEVKDGGK